MYDTLYHDTFSNLAGNILLYDNDCRSFDVSSFPSPLSIMNGVLSFQACIAETKTTWSWLMQASQCMHVHLENASQYHQVSRAGIDPLSARPKDVLKKKN